MADNYITTVTEKGDISISEDVIAGLVGAALTEVDGVAGVANTVGSDILDLIGKRTLARGVKVSKTDDVVTVDVLIMVNFGCVVTEVAKNVQTAVSNALEAMSGISPVVNVHVSGVSFKPQPEK
ncbi:MAG: Asp23/Gls24 family envelope stress response protein [Clostridia bacterium]|nr:Asp23/Gls24 family envelope stress response protein [Clostridia bacterium]